MKTFLFSISLLLSGIVHSQTIDSAGFQYDANQHVLTGYLSGTFLNVQSIEDLKRIETAYYQDTLRVDLFFHECSVFPLNTPYDTTFQDTLVVPTGSRPVRVMTYMLENADSVNCTPVAQTYSVDTLDTWIQIPLSHSESEGTEIKLFPNPASRAFQVSGLGEESCHLYVYDLLGRKVLEDLSSNGSTDIRTLNQGVYIVLIETQRGAECMKLEKE